MTIVAVVAAKDRADTVAATVTALLPVVDRVVVVDDGSRDTTTAAASQAGADVLVLPRNRGKGGAVTAAVDAFPDAEAYLLVDADTGATASEAAALLGPIQTGRADMAIGVLPAAGRKGGLGLVRRISAAGIKRACHFDAKAPLSGQRAVRGDLLRRMLPLAPRFGLETALTIDACRAGARLVEVDVAMAHRTTGRSLAGFRHRGAQGADIARALWPRLTTARQRMAAIVAFFVIISAVGLWMGSRAEPASAAAGRTWSKVVLFDMPGLQWSDVGTGRLPNYDRLLQRGAVAATSVRTLDKQPTVAEGWTTVGAGSRAAATEQSGLAFDAGEPFENGTAADAAARRTGITPRGDVVVLGAAATLKRNAHKHLSSEPGALGDALHEGGKRTAAVGNGDGGLPSSVNGISRPAPLAVMDSAGAVDAGDVSTGLLTDDPSAPYGRRADEAAVLAAFDRARATADVIAVDSGDASRAISFAAAASPGQAGAILRTALSSTDRLLGAIADRVGTDTLLLVVSVAPPGDTWHLQPLLAVGDGVPHGYLHSPSVRRSGIVAITDLAPTVLHAVGLPTADGMIGHALRFRTLQPNLTALAHVDRDANFREGYWFRMTVAYIIFQSAIYVLALAFLSRPGGGSLGTFTAPLRWVLLAIAAFPLASFLFRAIPNVSALGNPGLVLMVVIDVAIVAACLRARRHPVSPLAWVMGATVALLCGDILTGARLQTSTLLGYSLHTAARFTGIGNTAFAALAATTLLAGALHVHAAPRRREALLFAGCLFAFVVLVDGAPQLGDDVGGILTLVPLFALLLFVLTGRKLRWRTVLTAAGATVAVLTVATVADLLRPADSRTHLGRFVAGIGNGSSDFGTTVSRKLTGNLRTYSSPWCWVVVVIAFYLLYVLIWQRQGLRMLPPGSALRAGVAATLAASIIGNLLNDSGVVVTALVFVYLGPFITLLAIDHDEPAPALIEPPPDPRPAAAARAAVPTAS